MEFAAGALEPLLGVALAVLVVSAEEVEALPPAEVAEDSGTAAIHGRLRMRTVMRRR